MNCPLKYDAKNGVSCKCDEDKCAWWDDTQCAVLLIAWRLEKDG